MQPGTPIQIIAYWMLVTAIDIKSFVANMTASRLSRIESEVRGSIGRMSLQVITPAQVASNAGKKRIYLSSVVGTAYNAQLGNSTDIRTVIRKRTFEALLSGNWSNTTGAVRNRSNDPTLYRNQYTEATCRASIEIGGPSC